MLIFNKTLVFMWPWWFLDIVARQNQKKLSGPFYFKKTNVREIMIYFAGVVEW